MVLLFINLECLRGLKKIKEYAFLMHIAIPLVASIILGIAYLFDKTKNAPLAAYMVSVILAFLTSQVIWLKRSRIRPTPSENFMGWIKLFRVSIPMLLTSSLFQVLGWTDVIMLGIFRTEREVGIYNIAMKIAIAVNIISMSISTIAAPKFAELYGQGDLKKLCEVIRNSTKLIFWTSLPVILILMLFPSFLLGIFGEEFKAGVYALLVLTVAQFINASCGSVGFILQMTGKELIFQNIMIGAAIINITLNGLLIPIYGINGAAFASLISVAFWNFMSVFYVRSKLHVVTIYLPGLGRRIRSTAQ